MSALETTHIEIVQSFKITFREAKMTTFFLRQIRLATNTQRTQRIANSKMAMTVSIGSHISSQRLVRVIISPVHRNLEVLI